MSAAERRPPTTATLTATRIILLLGGGLVALLLVAVTTWSVAGALVQASERADDTLVGRFDRAVVRVSGSVDIGPGPEGRARIVRRSDYAFDRPGVTQRIVDGVLEVRVLCRGLKVICHHDLDIALPPDVAVEVEASEITIVDTTGPIDVRSAGGEVVLERVAGPVDVTVGGGAILGHDLRSSDVRADTGGGSVELEFARPPDWVVAEAGAGAVEVVVPPGTEAYHVRADAGVGEDAIGVRTDPESPRVIRATAGAGSVEVRYGPG